MSSDNLDSIIERYKRELMAFDKSARQVSQEIPISGTEPANAASAPESVPVSLPEGRQEADSLSEQSPADIAQLEEPEQEEESAAQEQPDEEDPGDIVIMPDDTSPEINADENAAETERTAQGYNAPADANSNEYSPYYEDTDTEYTSYGDFLEKNPKNGQLRIQVFAADEAIPISNARVIVSCRINGEDHVFYDQLTDSNGIVYGLILPAPDKALSSYPTALRPYALYDVSVSHPNFVRAYFKGVLIFDTIETVQPAQLIPLSQAGPVQEDVIISEERSREE